MGNGTLGGMVFGATEHERIALNVDTLWSGGPRDAGVVDGPHTLAEVRSLLLQGKQEQAGIASKRLQGPISESYQALGDLLIEQLGDAGDAVTSYRRELDVTTAVATTTFRRNGVLTVRKTFVSEPDGVIVTRIESDVPAGLDLRIALQTPHPSGDVTSGAADIVLTGRAAEHVEPPHRDALESVRYTEGGGMAFACVARVTADGGTVRLDGDGLTVENADAVCIVVTAGTSYRSWDEMPDVDPAPLVSACKATLDEAGLAVVRGARGPP